MTRNFDAFPGRPRLNDDCVRGWSNKLGVTENELQVAVEKVGPRVEDVRRFLRK